MVASELFVGALPVEHHAQVKLLGLLEYAPLREDRGAPERLVLVPCHLLNLCWQVFPLWEDIRALYAGVLGYRLDERPLIDRSLIETRTNRQNAVVRPLLTEIASHQADDRGAVE